MESHPKKSNAPRLLVLAGALVCLLFALSPLWKSKEKGEMKEVLREELVLREGKFHLQGSNTPPYSGVVIERYGGGRLKSRSHVSVGLLEGISEGWHTNGQMQVQEHFRAGTSHGQRLKWHQNGQKQSEATIVEGKIEGMFRRWHDNGQAAEEIPMKAGQAEGVARSYYPSGAIKGEATLQAGVVKQRHFWKDGGRRGGPLVEIDPLHPEGPPPDAGPPMGFGPAPPQTEPAISRGNSP